MATAAAGFLREDQYMEKRQLFLRSYHFSRKRSASERLRSSAVRVRRLVWVRLCAVRCLPLLLSSLLRFVLRRRRLRRFHPLANQHFLTSTAAAWP